MSKMWRILECVGKMVSVPMMKKQVVPKWYRYHTYWYRYPLRKNEEYTFGTDTTLIGTSTAVREWVFEEFPPPPPPPPPFFFFNPFIFFPQLLYKRNPNLTFHLTKASLRLSGFLKCLHHYDSGHPQFFARRS